MLNKTPFNNKEAGTEEGLFSFLFMSSNDFLQPVAAIITTASTGIYCVIFICSVLYLLEHHVQVQTISAGCWRLQTGCAQCIIVLVKINVFEAFVLIEIDQVAANKRNAGAVNE